jgi:hypothetical protein
MHSYVAYGLGVQSTLPLPELQVGAGAAGDIVIREGPVDQALPGLQLDENGYHITPNEAYIRWRGYGTYRVRDGREIVIDRAPEADERTIRVPLLGMCLALLLVQRGLLVLHASAVVCAGGAVAFVGEKGYGKSTMAATLFGRGHPLITDDVLAIDDSSQAGPALALPGFPQFKLLPEAVVSALGEDPARLPRLATPYDKLARAATERFAQAPVPLRAVYVLAEGPAPAVRPFTREEATIQVIAHSLAGRYGSFLLRGSAASAHLRRCADLARNVTVQRLERPFALSLLPAVAHLLERQPEAAALSSGSRGH